MGWLILFSLIAGIGAIGVLVSIGRVRFQRRLAREVHALTALTPTGLPEAKAATYPAPVARYRALAVGDRAPVHALTLHHHGTFRMSPTAKPRSIHGAQVFTADPPGFVWTGRIEVFPGVWVEARDMAVGGRGSMRVLLDDTLVLLDAHGPILDQGSALRLLAEMPWYPTSLFDARSVSWSAIDATHARATLHGGDRHDDVSAVFEFGPDGLPQRMTAERFNGEGVLLPWGGEYRDYRAVSGMLVPFEAEVSWELPSGPCPYAHWLVDSVEYEELRQPQRAA
jgi:hypothetical protein